MMLDLCVGVIPHGWSSPVAVALKGTVLGMIIRMDCEVQHNSCCFFSSELTKNESFSHF